MNKKTAGFGCLGVIVLFVILVSCIAVAGTMSDDTEPDRAPESSETAPESPAPAAEEPDGTTAQENALRAAENYLDVIPLSYTGLIKQLEQGDGYTTEDATWAADNVEADWNEQAAKAAQNYLDLTPYSRDGLIEQLVIGDGFTQEQAEYGVDQTDL